MGSAAQRLGFVEPPVFTGMASWVAEFDTWRPSPRYRIDPELDVEILEHAVATAHGPRTGVSFITRGLCAFGQPELIFTWCGPRLLGTPSAAAIAALRAIGRAAAAGLALRPGSAYYLGDGALLEGVGLAGFVFVPAQAMPGLVPPRGALHAVAVTAAEIDLVVRTTVHRVTSRLGKLHRRFPWPVWSAPRRSVVRDGEATAIGALPRAIVPGFTVALDGVSLSLRLPAASRDALAAAIGDPEAVLAHGVVIGAEPDPASDAHLLWLPDERETHAISAPHAGGSRTAGAFLRVAGGDALRGSVLEDGFDLSLDPESRDSMCAALLAGDTWTGQAEAGEVRVSFV
jgi:hypothetical protein